MSYVTTQHYEVPGGTLRVVLTTEHAPTSEEREDLDRIADACAIFRYHHLVGTEHRPHAPDADIDEAIWELGGDEAICAG